MYPIVSKSQIWEELAWMALAQVLWGCSQAVSQKGSPLKAQPGLENPLWSPLLWLLAGPSSSLAVGWRLLFLTMSASPWHVLKQWQLTTPIANNERKRREGEREITEESHSTFYILISETIYHYSHRPSLIHYERESQEGVSTQKQGWKGTMLETGSHTLHIQESVHHGVIVGIHWDSQSHHPGGGHAWRHSDV